MANKHSVRLLARARPRVRGGRAARLALAVGLSMTIAGIRAWADTVNPAAGPAPSMTTPGGGAGSTGTGVTEPATGLIDDTDKAWVWSGMVPYTDHLLHGGTGHAGGPGTYGTYTFHGTAVDVIGLAAPSIVVDGETHPIGKASIILDGKQVSLSTMTADTPQYGSLMARLTGLANANHVIEVQADSGWIVVDYIQAALTPPGSSGYAGPTLIPEGNYVLEPRSTSGAMLGETDWHDGTGATLCAPSHDFPVVWHFMPVRPTVYEISLAAVPTEVLSVLAPAAGACAKYPRVGIWRDLGGPAQRWTVTPTDSGYVYITVSNAPRSSLNVCDRVTAVGTPLIAYPHDQGEPATQHDVNEQWMLTPLH
jgi:hypothetical protein